MNVDIDIRSEEERQGAWLFIAAATVGGKQREFVLRLSWVDYNYWSPDATDRPETVARAAMEVVLACMEAEDIPDEFDLARVRRWNRDADEAVNAVLRGFP